MELAVRSVFGAEVLARLPALGSQDLLAEGIRVAGPFRVVGILLELATAGIMVSGLDARI